MEIGKGAGAALTFKKPNRNSLSEHYPSHLTSLMNLINI